MSMREYALTVPAVSLSQAVGEELMKLRRGQDVTQAQLAKMTGVSRATIMRYEAGEAIKINELEKLCLALGDDPMALFQRAAAGVKREH